MKPQVWKRLALPGAVGAARPEAGASSTVHPSPLCSRLLAAHRCLSCFSAARSIGWGTLRGFGRPQGFPPASAPASPARPSQPRDPQGVVILLPVLTSRLCCLPARSLSPPEPQCPHHNRFAGGGQGRVEPGPHAGLALGTQPRPPPASCPVWPPCPSRSLCRCARILSFLIIRGMSLKAYIFPVSLYKV